MLRFLVVFLISLTAVAVGLPRQLRCAEYPFVFYTKSEWGGRPATGVTTLNTPVPYVVIHHTYEPGPCATTTACMQAMRSMQNYHQQTQGWNDIGYNFAIGGDGAVYEGRGWQAVGAHAVGYNAASIGIVFIGNFISVLPNSSQLQAARDLIAVGVELGYIRPNYFLIGHRQVSSTECPGTALFREISTWNHFTTLTSNIETSNDDLEKKHH